MDIFGPVLRGLRDALHLYESRQQVIAENLANVETPGYRARDMEFADELERAFDPGRARSEAEPLSPPEPTVDRNASVKADGNSVDVDLEMARLSDNALRIVALSRIVARKYAGMKQLISELR